MKRFLKLLPCLLLIALLACVAFQPTEANAASVDDLTFELNKDGNSYCVDDCDSSASGELTIPAIYQGKPVTSIGNYAFWLRNSLTTITIPDSVTSIGDDAFRECTSLTSITIPNSVTSIGNWAFCKCTSLTSITIPNSVTSIGSSTFDDCNNLITITIGTGVTSIGSTPFSGCTSLTVIKVDANNPQFSSDSRGVLFNKDKTKLITASAAIKGAYEIPDSVTSIDSYAFKNCDSLTSVTIPDSVTSIGYQAFWNCTSLTSVTIGAGVNSIGYETFSSCTSLTAFHVAANNPEFSSDSRGVLFNKDKTQLIEAPQTINGAYTIPNTVNTIVYMAFSNCEKLTSVTVSNSVTTIEHYAFSGCTNLTSISIPDSVTFIGDYAFVGCENLSYTLYANCKYLGNKTNPYLVLCEPVTRTITQLQIHKDTKIIGSRAFGVCNNLVSVVIPDNVQTIGDYAFWSCDGLKEITLGDGVVTIGHAAFWECTNLTSVTIGKNTTYIGESAFHDCTSLTSIVIPHGVTVINGWTFVGCDSLISITIPKSVTHINSYVVSHLLDTVYYTGTQAEWNAIFIAQGNNYLTNAKLILNYVSYAETDIEGYNRSATVTATGGANVWSKPYSSNDSKKIRTAAYNSKLNVVGKVVNSAGGLWYKLSDGNWVYSTSIRVTDYNAADMQAVNKTVVVTSWGANIWSKPYSSGDSKVAYSVEKTAALKIVAQVKNSTGGLWYKVSGGGWIYSKNVNERIFDPADVIAYKRSATVIVPGVINIWGQPSTKAPSTLTRTAAYQTKLNVVAKYTTSAGGLWYQLTDGNWVYSTNIRITDYNTADVQAINKTVTVTSWGANVWSKPYSSGDSKVVKTVAKSANVKVKAQVRNSTYGLWYQLADGSGWIYSKNVAVK